MDEARSDEALARDALRGDPRAFESLVDRYQKVVYNAAYRLVGNTDDARDVSQNIFLKVYQGLASFNDSHPFRSWIYRIAVNEALNFISRRRAAVRVDELDLQSPAAGPEQEFEMCEVRSYMQRALNELSPDYRAVIVLRHILGCSYEEMARILRTPEKTIKSRLFTGRQLMKRMLVQKGVM